MPQSEIGKRAISWSIKEKRKSTWNKIRKATSTSELTANFTDGIELGLEVRLKEELSASLLTKWRVPEEDIWIMTDVGGLGNVFGIQARDVWIYVVNPTSIHYFVVKMIMTSYAAWIREICTMLRIKFYQK